MGKREYSFISVPEAASLLGVSQPWVLRMLKAGTLKGFRVNGRAWAVDAESVLSDRREYETRRERGVGRPRGGTPAY